MEKKYYIIIASFFPEQGSARYPFGYDYVRSLIKDGRYNVVVFKPGIQSDYVYNGILVHALKLAHSPFASIPSFIFARRDLNTFARRLKQLSVYPKDIAVIEAYNEEFGFLGWDIKRFNEKIILALHHHSLQSVGVRNCRWINKMLNYWWMRKIHSSQDLHIFISDLAKQSIEQFPDTSWTRYEPYRRVASGLNWMGHVHVARSYILPNGVDRELFKCNQSRRDSGHIIGAISNYHDYKGLMTLLRATVLLKKKYDDLQVRFIGSGYQETELKEFVATNHLEGVVSFLPEANHEELPDFYNSIDLFVLPSYFEGFGCVYVESWCCGVPFMACCEGNGIAEFVDDKELDKWMVMPFDYESLAEKISNYFEHPVHQHLKINPDIKVQIEKYLDFLQGI